MKTILVPTDFSPCAEIATDAALRLAELSGSEIIFFHIDHAPVEVVNRMTSGPSTVLFEEGRVAVGHMKGRLMDLVNIASRQGIKAKYELVLQEGLDLNKYISANAIDLVVMGSHGSKGLKEVFLGSNTVRFIRDTNVPVLVVKEKLPRFPIKHIVFASDFHTDFIRPFQIVQEIASLFKAKIHLLCVNTPDLFRETKDILFEMKRFMHQFPGVTYTTNVFGANTESEGIHLFANSNNADLVGLTTRHRSRFSKTISPSIAENILHHERLPVLVSPTN